MRPPGPGSAPTSAGGRPSARTQRWAVPRTTDLAPPHRRPPAPLPTEAAGVGAASTATMTGIRSARIGSDQPMSAECSSMPTSRTTAAAARTRSEVSTCRPGHPRRELTLASVGAIRARRRRPKVDEVRPRRRHRASHRPTRATSPSRQGRPSGPRISVSGRRQRIVSAHEHSEPCPSTPPTAVHRTTTRGTRHVRHTRRRIVTSSSCTEQERRSPSAWPARGPPPLARRGRVGADPVASVVAIGTLLGSAFTSDGSLTTNPDSPKAEQVIADNFSQGDRIDEAVIIHSAELTSDDPEFRAFVAEVRSSIEDTGAAADRPGPLRSRPVRPSRRTGTRRS